jgi:hypothetical protein
LAAGLAAGTKLSFLAPVVALWLGLIVITRGRRLSTALWFGLPAALTGGYWFVRNLIAVGNPIPYTSFGPLHLPMPERTFELRPGFSVFHYATDTRVWSDWFFPGLDDWGYGEATEWRFTRGGYDTPGRADVWTRVRIPLVADEPSTGLARALIVADSANGLSAQLPMAQWLSIPPSMTTTLLREPVGDWTHLACRTHLAPDGIGLAHADISDPGGLLGEVNQPLLVRAR